MKRLSALIFAALIFSFAGHVLGEDTPKKNTENRPSYTCHKTKERIRIDGKLTEASWKNKPTMPFREIENGTAPDLETVTKLIWDDKYLYVGMEIKDPDVWARFGLRDDECSKELTEKIVYHYDAKNPQNDRLEAIIMSWDKFVKVFIDPDGDEKNYLEFHINPLNNVFDQHSEYGYINKWGDRELKFHFDWTCEGFLSATSIDGTLNAPHDVDNGWSVEIAIPWKSFAPFTKGSCPPVSGDRWTGHLGRVQRESFQSKRTYWTWPVIGQINCHLPDTYGFIIFSEE